MSTIQNNITTIFFDGSNPQEVYRFESFAGACSTLAILLNNVCGYDHDEDSTTPPVYQNEEGEEVPVTDFVPTAVMRWHNGDGTPGGYPVESASLEALTERVETLETNGTALTAEAISDAISDEDAEEAFVNMLLAEPAAVTALVNAIMTSLTSTPQAMAALAGALISNDAQNTIVAAPGDGLLYENDAVTP